MSRRKLSKYEPVLRYLVEVGPAYVSHKHEGFCAGVQAWFDPDYLYSLDAARVLAAERGGKVIKLRIRAFAEEIKGPAAEWKAPVVN